MKKIAALILAAALLFSACAFADDADVVGCWACYEMLTDGAPAMSMLYLSDDHTCYYLIQSFHPDEPGLGRAYVGTWEIQNDGSIYAKTGNNTETILQLYSSNIAIEKSSLNVFVNITQFTLK